MMRSARLHACAALTVAMFAIVPLAAAGEPAHAKAQPPAHLSRTLRNFDFEERARGNLEDAPLGWLKVEGPGLPHYLSGRFDEAVSAAGRTSFRFDLNGGSVTYRYPAGRIRVMSGASYRLTAMCRTTPLKGARARLTAYLCDVDGRMIDGSTRSTAPFASPPGDEAFHPLALDLNADDPAAASIVLELALLQPALLADGSLGERALPVEDIRGSAWFDEVRVAQVPEVSVSSDSPTNVFAPGEPINVRVRVRDRITGDLTCELRVFDIDGNPVHQRTGAIDFADAGEARVGEAWAGEPLLGTVTLPRLAPGWYEARLTLRSHDQFVAERSLRLAQLGAAPGPARPDPRFGVVATDVAPDAWDVLPAMLDAAAAGRVKVSAWTRGHAIDGAAAPAFDRLLDALRRRGVAITACLSALPPEVSRGVGGDAWSDLLRVPTDRWQPQLAYLISRHATHVAQWQLMDDDAADAYATRADHRAVYGRVFDEFSRLIGTPDLALAWPALFDLDAGLPVGASVALAIPGDVLPEQIPLYLRDAAARSGQPASVTLRPINAGTYGRAAQVRDLALRVAHALAGGAERIELPMPMTATRPRDGAAMAEPGELMIPQRVILSALSNARYAGTVSIAPGVDAFLFDRDEAGGGRSGESRSGVMLVSTPSQAPPPAPRTVSLALGRRATMIDLDGNVTSLARSADRRRPGDFDVPIGAMPFFVTEIDAPLMLLRASVAIDNPLLESSVVPVGRTLSLRNTFDAPITGSLRVTGPAGWTLTAPAMPFSLAPGETLRVPLTLRFPTRATAGDQALSVELNVQGREDYRLTVPVAVKLGLSDVGLQTFAMRGGDEVIVQQLITNYGSEPIHYDAFVVVGGLPRQERVVSALAPGKTTIRKYRVPMPRGSSVATLRSGVREIEGKRMLNDEIEIR